MPDDKTIPTTLQSFETGEPHEAPLFDDDDFQRPRYKPKSLSEVQSSEASAKPPRPQDVLDATHPAVTLESVTAALDSLKAQNRKPSLRTIRETIGSGSLSTIHAILKRIQADSPSVPLDTQEKLRPLMVVAAELVKTVAEETSSDLRAEIVRINADLDEVSKSLAAIEANYQDLNVAYDKVSDNCSYLVASLKQAREALGATAAKLEDEQKELAISKLRAEDYQIAREEAKEAQERAAKLEGLLEALEGKRPKVEPLKARGGGSGKK
jgi:ABC-type transporter Mla subunit MlaD